MRKEQYKVHMIGNAHLDPVWLWRWQEGFAEVKATFRSALDRMEEFPDFIFTCAGAAYYKWVEENAPEMFEEICERVAEGRWVIVGGWWIQPDCNIPSGESFARHSLYSQLYFKRKFGRMARVGYNVDSFGHNGMLPQILKKSGMDTYVFMRPGDHEKELPGNLFWWESPDGTRVLTFKIPFSYGDWGHEGEEGTHRKIREVRSLAESQGIDFMSFYGVGNHGGGPTIRNLESIQRLQQEWSEENLILSSPDSYFRAIIHQNPELPVVRDDLQHHASGCYSAHSETKKSNRKSEHRLLTAEKFMTLAHGIVGLPYAGEEIKRGWERVLFNQFHDTMGGCSIKEAYEDARESYGEALHIGAQVLNNALQKISWAIDTMGDEEHYLSKEMDWKLWEQNDKGTPLVVFNPLSWEIKAPIQVNKKVKGITDDQGNAVEIQQVRGSQTNGEDKWDTLFMAELPAMGYRVYWIYINKEWNLRNTSDLLKASDGILENEWTRLEIDSQTGYIARLYDKSYGVEVLRKRGAVPIVIDESHCDTWAHGVFEFHQEAGTFKDASVRLMESGPLRARLRVTQYYGRSTLQQDFILYRDKPDIEVRVKLDWREKHKMLKLSFSVNVDNPRAFYEIPYGFIERPVNGEEEPGQQWVDVTGDLPHKVGTQYGMALLNDCKYSFDVKDGELRMTVVRSPIFADHFGGRDEWCEYMDQGVQEFTYAIVPHSDRWKTAGVVQKAFELNVLPEQIIETYHKGILPRRFDGIHISASQIIATAFKRAEDGAGYILRCCETTGQPVHTTIEIPMLRRKWEAKFGGCEIKTFRIPMKLDEEIGTNDLIEMEIQE